MRDQAIQHAIYLRRFSTGLANRIIKLLNRVDDDVAGQIRKGSLDKTSRLNKILEEIRIINRDIHKEVGKELRTELKALARYEADLQAKLVAGDKTPIVLSPDVLGAMVDDEPFQGRTLKDWLYNLRESSYNRVKDTINIGVVQGETTDQIVNRVLGLKRLRYTDGVNEMNRRAATAVIRTAVTHTTSKADEAVYQRQKNIQGVQYSAILDSRTTPICASLDGQVFKVGEGPRPPQHFNCRSTTIPVFKGQEPFEETYNEWLKRQSKEFQDDILGNTRGRLFRDGGLAMDRFVDPKRGQFWTLDQLKSKENEAFNLVGL